MSNGSGNPDELDFGPETSGTTDTGNDYQDFMSSIFDLSQTMSQMPGTVSFEGLTGTGNILKTTPGSPHFTGVEPEVAGPYMSQPGIFDPHRQAELFPGHQRPRIPQSINQAVALVHNLPENKILEWKSALYDAGLYSPSFYNNKMKPRQVGIMDEQDTAAMTQLAAISARARPGTTLQDVLAQLRKDNPFSAENGFGEKRQPRHITAQVHDPATVRKYARAAAQELLGRDLDDKALNALTKKLIAQETGAVTGQAKAQLAAAEGESDSVTVSSDFDVAARTEEAVEAANASEAEAKRFANGYDVFMKMVLGGG